MAQPIPCDVCEQTTADFLITDVSDGSVMGLGIECVLDWAVPIAEAFQAARAHEGDPGPASTVSPQAADKAWEASARTDGPKSPEAAETTDEGHDTEDTDTAETSDVGS